MGSDMIVLFQGAIEAFIVSILPRTTEIDLDRLDADLLESSLQITAINPEPLSDWM